MKYKNQIVVLVFSVVLLCAFRATVCAHEVPDEDAEGTIIMEMKYDGAAVIGGTLTAYRVGQIRESDGNYSFVKTDDMKAFSGNYNNISDPKLAENIAAFVQANNLSACAVAENKDGKVVFTDLELGLYLIVQTKASDGYKPIKPFLVSIPMNEDGHYIYEVNVEGKFELRKKPKSPVSPATPGPTDPVDPDDPKLPQTGQLNWPVPVFTVLGLLLFAIGWLLRFGMKGNSNEK